MSLSGRAAELPVGVIPVRRGARRTVRHDLARTLLIACVHEETMGMAVAGGCAWASRSSA